MNRPEVHLLDCVDALQPLMTSRGERPRRRLRSAERFAVVEWDFDSPLRHRYLLETSWPSVRLLGGLSLDDALPAEVRPVTVGAAIERAEAGLLDWLRAAANSVRDHEVERLRTAVERALRGDPASERAAALAAIESGRPELHETLVSALPRLEDRNLERTARVAHGLRRQEWPSAMSLAWWAR